MRKKQAKTFLLYFILGGFILGWWSLAFKDQTFSSSQPLLSQQTSASLILHTSALFPDLSSLQRDALHQALAGDFKQMVQLIAEWDIDAQILQAKGIVGIQRLQSDLYLRAHALHRLLQEPAKTRLAINRQLKSPYVMDDNGRSIYVRDDFNRFLPQTFFATSILLAIAPPKEVIAIPKVMRDLPQLYPSHLIQQVSGNLDEYQGEKLLLAQPHLAFVSHYSHPPTLEVLRNQGLELYTIKNIETFADIQTNMVKVGHASNHPLEAHLLSIFTEACMLMLDNRFRALHTLACDSHTAKTILYLYCHQYYALPTTKCLTGQLLKRAHTHHPNLHCIVAESHHEWQIPLEREKIMQMDPDCLLIARSPSLYSHEEFPTLFKDLKAFKNQHIFYLDECTQSSADQYHALAYFDIFQALATLHLP